MAEGDPITVSLTGTTFLLSAETGCIIESVRRSTSSKRKEVYDASVGYTKGMVFYDFVASISLSAVINGTTGVALAAPGVALTLTNALGIGTAKNGVSAGGIYVSTVDIDHGEEDFRKISVQAEQRQNVA